MAAGGTDTDFKLVTPDDDVECDDGDDVTLPGHLSPETSAVAMEIKWFMGTDCIYLYKNGHVTEGRGYEGRVSVDPLELQRGGVSLTLRGSRWRGDRGVYTCQVISGGHKEEGRVRLKISVAGLLDSQFHYRDVEQQRPPPSFSLVRQRASPSNLRGLFPPPLCLSGAASTDSALGLSDEEAPPSPPSILGAWQKSSDELMEKNKLLEENTEISLDKTKLQLEEKNTEMEKTKLQLEERDKLLHQRDTELENMREKEKERQSLLENMMKELETSKRQLESLEKELQDRNSQLQDLRTQLREQEKELEERNRQLKLAKRNDDPDPPPIRRRNSKDDPPDTQQPNPASWVIQESLSGFIQDQEDFDSVDIPDMKTVERLTKDAAGLDISNEDMLCQYDRLTHHCKSCDIEENSHWIFLEPSVSTETGFLLYKHSSPPGSFECTMSGLRWVCADEVTLHYHFCDPDIFRAELALSQYEPIGPLMDITVLSGELLEAHLPHFACLEGSDVSLKEAVRVMRGVESGITLETCELTPFHARLIKPSFSLTEVLVKIGFRFKTHIDVLIYRTRINPLTLHTYVVPRDASMIQAVKDDVQENINAKRIKKHRPNKSIRMKAKFRLNSSYPLAEISPEDDTLKYITPPDLFEVRMFNVVDSFDLELLQRHKSIWKATLRSADYDENVSECHKMAIPAYRTAVAYDKEGEMASMTNKDRLLAIRPELIQGISEPIMKNVLDRLQAHHVMSGREAEEISQRTNVVQDQVAALIDMVLKKGQRACDMFLSLLRKCDTYFYKDLGLQDLVLVSEV